MALLLLIVVLFAYIGITAIWRGFALTYLWQWFVVPLGVPAISLWHAAGISLVVAFLTYQVQGDSETKDVGSTLLMPLLMPAFALFFGWVWHSFM